MFNLYFAGSHVLESNKTIIDLGGHRLYSQINDRSNINSWINEPNQKGSQLFVDSGAFSAFTKGIDINTDDYISYINSISDNVALFAAIDKIPGSLQKKATISDCNDAALATWDNFIYMRERIKEPKKLLATFHINEDFSNLKRILETKFDNEYLDYIALGGIAKQFTKVRTAWLNEVFQCIRKSKNPNVKVHGFGMTNQNLLQMYPFYSADSTSWIMTTANGCIFTKFGTICVSDKQLEDPKHVLNLSNAQRKDLIHHVAELGYNLEDLSKCYKERASYNIKHIMRWCENYKYVGTSYQKKLF